MASSEKNLTFIARARELSNVPWSEEYECMVSGMPYRPWESDILRAAQARAGRLVNQYNKVARADVDDERARASVLNVQSSLLQSLFGACSETVTIEAPFSVLYGCNTRIGKHFFGNVHLSIDDSALVSIGDNVTIGPEVYLITTNHATDVAQRLKGVMYTRPITIGDACWIGARVTILPGVAIGYGCTIGAGAVVSRDIPAYSIAVGNPARVVKQVNNHGAGEAAKVDLLV